MKKKRNGKSDQFVKKHHINDAIELNTLDRLKKKIKINGKTIFLKKSYFRSQCTQINICMRNIPLCLLYRHYVQSSYVQQNNFLPILISYTHFRKKNSTFYSKVTKITYHHVHLAKKILELQCLPNYVQKKTKQSVVLNKKSLTSNTFPSLFLCFTLKIEYFFQYLCC